MTQVVGADRKVEPGRPRVGGGEAHRQQSSGVAAVEWGGHPVLLADVGGGPVGCEALGGAMVAVVGGRQVWDSFDLLSARAVKVGRIGVGLARVGSARDYWFLGGGVEFLI